ncbi:hypothetical protein, partial [Allofournierella sp.]|uniref:hypothetical protein n=3 Tax=Allofournierella sp. TaxID=1940256 RepID=UPI003AF7129A
FKGVLNLSGLKRFSILILFLTATIAAFYFVVFNGWAQTQIGFCLIFVTGLGFRLILKRLCWLAMFAQAICFGILNYFTVITVGHTSLSLPIKDSLFTSLLCGLVCCVGIAGGRLLIAITRRKPLEM